MAYSSTHHRQEDERAMGWDLRRRPQEGGGGLIMEMEDITSRQRPPSQRRQMSVVRRRESAMESPHGDRRSFRGASLVSSTAAPPSSTSASTRILPSIISGAVRSSGDVLNRLEREMGREEFNDTRPEIAFKRMALLQSMAAPLRFRRQTVRRINQEALDRRSGRAAAAALSWFDAAKFGWRKSYETMGAAVEQGNYLWAGKIKAIEGQHGSGVGSYFRFLRFLFKLNVVLGLVSFCFLSVPQILDRFYENGNRTNTEEAYDGNFSFGDIFTGGGWFKNTELFYGCYTSETIQATNSVAYAMDKAYFYAMLCCYIFSLVVNIMRTATNYRASFIDTQSGGLKSEFCNRVFCSWDHSVTGDKAAQLRLESTANNFLERLEKSRDAVGDSSRVAFALVVLLNTVVVVGGAFVGTWYLVPYATSEFLEASETNPLTTSEENLLLLALPLSISGLMLIVPMAFGLLSRLEKYHEERHRVYMNFTRTGTLALSIIGILLYNYYSLEDGLSECYETKMGQEMYRLTLMFLLILVALPFILETLHMLLYTKAGATFLGAPKFDISNSAVLIIFAQTVTWIGHYFSPLLPIVFAIVLFITFYVKKLSLELNCKLSRTVWRAAQSQTIFMFASFIALLFSIMATIYVWAQIPPSNSCGPFQEYSSVVDIGFWTSADYNPVLFSPPFMALVVIILLVAVYYARAYAKARKNTVQVLRKRIETEGKTKTFLILMMRELKKRQSQHRERKGSARPRRRESKRQVGDRYGPSPILGSLQQETR